MRGRLGSAPSIAFVATGIGPAVLTDSMEGPTIDFGANRPGFAIQQVGTLLAGTTVAGLLQQSANGSSWSAISGATFADVSSSNDIQKIAFTPTMRYVRWAADITGDTPSAAVAVTLAR